MPIAVPLICFRPFEIIYMFSMYMYTCFALNSFSKEFVNQKKLRITELFPNVQYIIYL